MKYALVILSSFLALATPVFAQTSPQTPVPDPNAMRHCQSFSECTLVWGGCGDTAINKVYVNQFKPAAVCDASQAHNPKSLPTCTDGLCVVVVPDQKQ